MSDEKKISPIRKRKAENIDMLKDKLGKSKAYFLTDYRGISHQQLEKLRKGLKKVQAEYVVAKNTFLKRALEKSDKKPSEQFEKAFNEPTAVLFVYEDAIEAIKVLAKFIKDVQLPKIKIGLFENEETTEDGFKKLATLPSREILLATLLSRMQSPISNLQYALNWNLQKLVIALDNIKKSKK